MFLKYKMSLHCNYYDHINKSQCSHNIKLYCVDCNLFICDQCHPLPGHRIYNIFKSSCELNKHIPRIFCLNCAKFYCISCMGNHLSHSIVSYRG